ncbi:MAG TPA: PEGA domain-containing protein [Thermoplasmata archaeon]|nr:PEGA domain-containing protein [Thermoplasmata archaeon]
MKKGSALVVLVLVVLTVGLLTAPAFVNSVNRSSHSSSVSFGPAAHLSVASATPRAPAAAPHPQTTYPRTIMVETFTGEWCPHCVLESQALWWIEHNATPGSMVVAELHTCYSSSSCGDNYQPTDGSTQTRANYYNVQGYPTVMFDGLNPVVGDTTAGLGVMESMYNTVLHNASLVPGNVSITQSASLTSSSQVTVNAQVTSGVTGSFHAITYLQEFIGKNDSSQHDMLNVVRSTVADQVVSLTAGETTPVTAVGSVDSTWNPQHLSVVTFIQDATTMIVQNANEVPVDQLTTSVVASPTSISAGATSSITVTVSNSSSGAVVSGAAVTLSSTAGGALNPTSGPTASDGTFTSTFTAANVSSTETAVITATATKPGATIGPGTATIMVLPLVPPSAPVGLTVIPENQQVLLNWSAPASGGAGVTYSILRSDTQSGGYAEIGTSITTSYTDTGASNSQSYWYTVRAQGPGGTSVAALAISATSVMAKTQGLPVNDGWWLTIDSVTVTSGTNGAIAVHLPDGPYAYTFGSSSFAYLPVDPSNSVPVAGAPVTFTASFVPNYATLQGTVTPASANVVLNGTTIQVVDGSFVVSAQAGTYPLTVTASGYTSNTTSVTLTPGNTTTADVQLSSAPSTGTTTSGGAVSEETIALAAIAAAVAVGVGLVAVFGMKSKKGGRRPRSPPDETGDT